MSMAATIAVMYGPPCHCSNRFADSCASSGAGSHDLAAMDRNAARTVERAIAAGTPLPETSATSNSQRPSGIRTMS
jgi:hypothetical protein